MTDILHREALDDKEVCNVILYVIIRYGLIPEGGETLHGLKLDHFIALGVSQGAWRRSDRELYFETLLDLQLTKRGLLFDLKEEIIKL
jgi:hypothetical protein